MPAEPPSQLIDLALQGGGSHGAFTWGVLDRLLEEPWLSIEAISGTSAGAMNAAVLADGHAEGGDEGAREALEAFWRRVSQAAAFSPLQRSPLDVLLGRWTLDHSPAFVAIDMMARAVLALRPRPSAAQSAGRDPGRSRSISRGWPRAPIKLFITATNVRTGRAARVPQRRAVTRRAARLGLPADHVPGRRDRRRGLLGRRLFRQSDHDAAGAANASRTTRSWSQINPVERPGMPRSARDILNRLNEVSFNAVLLKELRMIALLRQVAAAGDGEGAHWARMRIHMIAQRHDGRARLLLQAQCRMGLPQPCCATRAAARPRPSSRRTATISGKRSTLDIDRLLEGV